MESGIRLLRVVLFVPQIYRLGGAERLAVELAEELAAREGVAVDLLSLAPITGPAVAVARRLEAKGVGSVESMNRPPRSGVWEVQRCVRALHQRLLERRYDVIDSTLPTPSTLATWARRGTKTAHVSGIHDLYAKRQWRRRGLLAWLLSVRLNTETTFYAISGEAAREWVEFAGVSASRTRVILNSIHKEYFSASAEPEAVREECGFRCDTKLLLFVGRLVPAKGIDTLIDGVLPLLEAGVVGLLVVGVPNASSEAEGGNSTEFFDRLQARVRGLAGERGIRWLGWRQDVARLMASADLLVHPARFEGFGLVVAEALAAGLPVVSTAVGGIPEVLRGTDSVLVAPGDPQALRNAIASVLARTQGEQARARAKGQARAKLFSVSRRADELLALYRTVAST